MRKEEEKYTVIDMPMPDDYEGTVKATLLKLCAARKSSSAVLYIHGYLDYYFQYHMGEYFAAQGKNFYAVDLRKYGRSWMPHQHFNYCRSLREYYPDLDAAIDRIIVDGNTDITLIGHSTGGLLGCLYCAEGGRKDFVNRLILNSPFLEFNTGAFKRNAVLPLAGAISRIFPYAHKGNELSPNYFKSIHRSQFGEWEFDTKLKPEHNPPLYFAWLRAVRNGQKKVKEGLKLPVPVLVMFSDRSTYHKNWHEEALTSDTILNVEHIMKYGAMLGDNVRLEKIEDGLHDLMLSRRDVREKVLTVMDYFISEKRGV